MEYLKARITFSLIVSELPGKIVASAPSVAFSSKLSVNTHFAEADNPSRRVLQRKDTPVTTPLALSVAALNINLIPSPDCVNVALNKAGGDGGASETRNWTVVSAGASY